MDEHSDVYKQKLKIDLYNVKLALKEWNYTKRNKFYRRGVLVTLATAVGIGSIYYLTYRSGEAFLYGAMIGGYTVPILTYLYHRRWNAVVDIIPYY